MAQWTKFALLAAMAVACGKDETTPDDTTDTTTDTTDTTPTVPVTTPFDDFADADLTDVNAVKSLTFGSAPQIWYSHFVWALGATVTDVDCPVVSTTPTSTTYTGGCTDSIGVEWGGSYTYGVGTDGDIEITWDNFSLRQPQPCDGGGTVDNVSAFDGTFGGGYYTEDFEVSTTGTATVVDTAACTAATRNFKIEYTGTQVEIDAYNDRFDGSGTYADDVGGKAEVQTIGEILGDACGSEAVSGVTLLTTPTDQVSIIYDGAIDCDATPTVNWQLNGVPQGEIEGVACSSTGSAGLGLFALAPLAALIRRRRA